MKVIVSFSGGKDSQACLIWAIQKYGKDKVEAVFCDTGWEHPSTYNHIKEVIAQVNIKFTIIKGQYDFVSLAKYKNRFPSTDARFCTEELKVKPMIDWVLQQEDNLIIIQGIRSGESQARRKMDIECMYFKNYFEPLQNGKKYSYRGKEVRERCKKYDASVLRPIKDWSSQDVVDFILNAGQKPNPLYYQGFSRVGCFPCIMCRKSEVRLLAENYPEMLQRLVDAENSLYGVDGRGSSFSPLHTYQGDTALIKNFHLLWR
jgi:3'-phosphoadenosine 5'-phosphosulfate sulfotransferase (PAPS reductase)/FAD synthetase